MTINIISRSENRIGVLLRGRFSDDRTRILKSKAKTIKDGYAVIERHKCRYTIALTAVCRRHALHDHLISSANARDGKPTAMFDILAVNKKDLTWTEQK